MHFVILWPNHSRGAIGTSPCSFPVRGTSQQHGHSAPRETTRAAKRYPRRFLGEFLGRVTAGRLKATRFTSGMSICRTTGGKRRNPFDNGDKSSFFDSEEKREIVDGVIAERNKRRIYLSTFSIGDTERRGKTRDTQPGFLSRGQKIQENSGNFSFIVLRHVC